MTTASPQTAKGFPLIAVITLLTGITSLFSSGNLPEAWRNDPYCRTGGWAALIWISIFAFIFFQSRRQTKESGERLQKGAGRLSIFLLTTSIILIIAGNGAQLNILRNLALALVVASLIRHPGLSILMIVASTAWIPATGWLGHQLLEVNIDFWRIPVVLFFSALPLLFLELRK